MRRLMLLRHAKSDWTTHLRDIDRPLNARGRDAAARIGAYMAASDLVPDLALVSSAARARETWALLSGCLHTMPAVRFDARIYEAAPQTIFSVIKEAPASARALLVIGHNPGLQSLAFALIGSGDAEARMRLTEKFPTAGLAVIDFGSARWADIRPGAGALDRFVTPRVLADAES